LARNEQGRPFLRSLWRSPGGKTSSVPDWNPFAATGMVIPIRTPHRQATGCWREVSPLQVRHRPDRAAA